MFAYFGGGTSVLVVDNVVRGFTRTHLNDPDVNSTTRLCQSHWDYAVPPARPRKTIGTKDGEKQFRSISASGAKRFLSTGP